MTVNLITFVSPLHRQTPIRNSHEVLLAELEKYFTINLVDHSNIGKLTQDDFSIVFIATGGVEKLVAQHFEALPRPTALLTDGIYNSLPAALEIASWLHNRGMKNEILHGEPTDIAKRLFILYNNFRAQRALSGRRIGVIGAPSGWLIASNVDFLLAKRRWEVEYINVPIERVYEYYALTSEDEVGEEAAVLAEKALACREASPEDLLKAMKLHAAIRKLVREERLDALTLSCFRVIDQVGTTGCLALALLNDEGIIAGCEGDLQAVFTMMVAKTLTGQAPFMGNPSLVNVRNNELVLSHCTVGLKQTERFIIRSHFETGTGIGIQGILPEGEVTLVKCGGECLDEYYLSSGTLVENTNHINMCRTQVKIRMNTPADYFLKNPLGNHHILLHGNHEAVLNEFFQANGCKRIE
ncbi:fucose isomerase [uncultured Bacteroides sp.]|uniref:fucose isomerase n=1 Tax=uncultured Bacteroides sp. TaxID=162156 RepID=UPI00262AFCE0|nr:fucose isomerase [uncultured Bacteroides sp.]